MIKNWTLALITCFSLGTAVAYEDCCYNDSCCSSSCLDGLTVGVDLLYWHPCIPQLDYAIVFNGDPIALTEVVDGKYRYIDHGWDPGARVYLGYNLCNSCYSLWGSYTWYSSDKKSQYERAADEFVFPTLFNQSIYVLPGGFTPVPGNAPTVLSVRNDLDYQSFDLLVAYNQCCFGPCQVLRFFGGIEGVKIDQSIDLFVDTPLPADYALYWTSECKGLGLKIGSAYEWNLQCGVGITAEASFSVVAGDNSAKNRQQQIINPGEGPLITIERSFKDCECLCLPGAHLGLGLNYETCLCDWEVGVRAGYEFTSWWNVPVARRFTATPSQSSVVGQGYATSGAGGNLILHGIYVGAFVNF